MARRTTAALVAASVALTLAACSGGGSTDSGSTATDGTASGEITFTWWGNEDRAAKLEEALDLFSEEYPDIDVVRNFNSWDDYWTARNTEAAGQSLPDVFMMDVGYIGQYANKGLFLDLSSYEGGLLDTSDFSDSLLASGEVDGEVIGVPLGYGVWSMMYNKDLLDSLGIEYPSGDMDQEEFLAWASEVNAAGASVSPALYGTDDYTGSLPAFMYWLMQDGNEVFTDDGQAAFTEDDVVEFLETGAEGRDDSIFFPIERSAALEPSDGAGAGEIAAWASWSTTLTQAMSDLGSDNIGMTTPPLVDGTDTHVLSEKASMLLSASANTSNPDAAVTLINFLANSTEVAEIVGSTLGTPATEARAAAAEDSAADLVINEYLADVAEEISISYPPIPTGYGTIESTWVQLHEQLRYGEITEDEFASTLFDEIDMAFTG
ncbi:MAG TPA: extracellular solute-binding protein [Cellulomonas sp.]